MWYYLTAVTIIAAAAVIYLLLQRLEIKNITAQLKELKEKDTNSQLHTNGGTKSCIGLVNEINDLLRQTASIRIDCERKNHELEQMMTNISHDLRTPLTSAMGYLNIILSSDISEEEKEREITVIAKRLVRLEELINSFFEFSRIISNGRPPEMCTVNLNSILERSIVHYYDDYCAAGREIIFSCGERRVQIFSNENMLLRIFDNLISNALKHGHGDLSVTLKTDGKISVVFENQADAAENIDTSRIFEEYYTMDISRTKGNTGLGLAIARQFTLMLGGNIFASCSEGRFMITVELGG